jgi:hypothetical protein
MMRNVYAVPDNANVCRINTRGNHAQQIRKCMHSPTILDPSITFVLIIYKFLRPRKKCAGYKTHISFFSTFRIIFHSNKYLS